MTYGKNLTVVYISSSSRSGATIIEDHLTGHFGGVTCRELNQLSEFANGRARIDQKDGAQDKCARSSLVPEFSFCRALSDEARLNRAENALRSRLGLFQFRIMREPNAIALPIRPSCQEMPSTREGLKNENPIHQ